jgi:glycosyltransferase involved in cell wall biosynthesis
MGGNGLHIIHVLHHSVSPFCGQYPDKDPLHYDSGFPMQFARETRKRYPGVELECWRPEHTLRREHCWFDETNQISHRVFPSAFLRYGWELSLPMLRAARDLAQMKCVCFFVHGSYNWHAYALTWALSGAPIILQSHGGLPAMARMKVSRRFWLKPLFLPLALIERLTLSHYPHIFAVNMQEKRSLETLFPKAAVYFSPVSIDFDLFSPGDKGNSRQRLGLVCDAQTVLYVGRLAPEKGIEYLLAAIAQLTAPFPRLQLYLVGSGPSESALRQQAQALGLQKQVHFVGYVPRPSLVDWYRAADVVCLPSLFEGFPLTAAEAMACGTPLVASRAGGMEDVVREFECGILTPAGDPGALKTAIEQYLLGETTTIPNIGRARNLLDWSGRLRDIISLFEQM